MQILPVPPEQAPINLLTLADPSTERVLGYIQGCKVFVGQERGATVAVAAVHQRQNEFELMAIAVVETCQGRGVGRRMIEYVLQFAKANGAKRVTVGTGNSSLGQQAFYEKIGFKPSAVIEDYFKDYDPPIFENGIRCLDMIRFSFEFNDTSNRS